MFRFTVYIPFLSERDFNMKKNQATLFLGVIDGQNYLLDVNDSGSYHAKGGQYIVIVAEDSIKVWVVMSEEELYLRYGTSVLLCTARMASVFFMQVIRVV